jgi:hypothetical protein
LAALAVRTGETINAINAKALPRASQFEFDRVDFVKVFIWFIGNCYLGSGCTSIKAHAARQTMTVACLFYFAL